MNLTDCTVSGNTADLGGGGIYKSSWGSLTITDSRVISNTARDGGGIYSRGAITLRNSAVSGSLSLTTSKA